MNCNYCLHFTMKHKTDIAVVPAYQTFGLSLRLWYLSNLLISFCPQFSPKIDNNIESNQRKYSKNNLLLMNVYIKCFICRGISLFFFSRVAVILACKHRRISGCHNHSAGNTSAFAGYHDTHCNTKTYET